MSEKRFICGLGFPINSDDPIRIISDNVEDKDYYKFSDICNVLNEQQATISALKEENEQLRQMIKENVFHQYNEGSLADLKFKAIAYDDIIKVEMSNELEPRVIVYCNYGKRDNVMSFCQMFIPFGIAYEIKEVIDDE